MKISLILSAVALLCFNCNPQHSSISDQWLQDSTGCLGYRTFENFEAMLKETNTKKVDSFSLLKMFGIPQAIFRINEGETLNKYIVAGRCFKGVLDTCFAEVILNHKQQSIISYQKICQ